MFSAASLILRVLQDPPGRPAGSSDAAASKPALVKERRRRSRPIRNDSNVRVSDGAEATLFGSQETLQSD